ncbi:hypothetical protein KY290_033842 [Solanum tuberosum]|uniref:Uncharacterized protein n=1 Tax=Solanum tuberosum TaxID=4113 RepID=A0ABQ7U1J0_SOLTU|nr:hypothetical protein KY289_030495 [Solanum tuberosum]KAH0740799.1 hypothetical protein KY290_033842 [Solanum tuberosum]
MWYHRQHRLHLGNVLELSTDEMVATEKVIKDNEIDLTESEKRINQARFTNINKISNLELEALRDESVIKLP